MTVHDIDSMHGDREVTVEFEGLSSLLRIREPHRNRCEIAYLSDEGARQLRDLLDEHLDDKLQPLDIAPQFTSSLTFPAVDEYAAQVARRDRIDAYKAVTDRLGASFVSGSHDDEVEFILTGQRRGQQ